MIVWGGGFGDLRGGDATALAFSLGPDALAPTPQDLAAAPAREPLRERFLRRRAASRRAVAARLGVAAESVVIGHAETGAPIVLAPDCGLQISVSGREDFCAIAMAERPIGVDIEPLRGEIEPPWNMFHPRERAALRSLSGAARHEAFLRLWTAKEAYLKALGVGLRRESASFAIDLDFAIYDEHAPAAVAACGWRRLTLGGEALIAACVVLRA